MRALQALFLQEKKIDYSHFTDFLYREQLLFKYQKIANLNKMCESFTGLSISVSMLRNVIRMQP